MIQIMLSIVLIMTLISSIVFVVIKRKKVDMTGIKSALTPICFFLISITSLFAYWFDVMGLAVWIISIVLLILGAYFTKYMHISDQES